MVELSCGTAQMNRRQGTICKIYRDLIKAPSKEGEDMARKLDISVGELRSRGITKLRGEGMFAVWVKTACCNLTSKQLRRLADITDKYARS